VHVRRDLQNIIITIIFSSVHTLISIVLGIAVLHLSSCLNTELLLLYLLLCRNQKDCCAQV